MTSDAQRVTVLGAGSWGTAIAKWLAEYGHQVTLWSYEPEVAKTINDSHENSRYLPGFTLPNNLTATDDPIAAVKDRDIIFQVTPSHGVRGLMTTIRDHLVPGTPIVSASKGIENSTLMTISEILEDVLPEEHHPYLLFLSGPSFAREVAARVPTAVVLASRMPRIARRVQQALNVPYVRTYISTDIPGVEFGGAIKNVIAIAAGAAQGMELGQNTHAAVITRGLAEITRLATRHGATPLTLAGLAGMGDLVLTCNSKLSRNFSVGFKLGQGQTIDQVLGDMIMVAEGVKTARSVRDLSNQLNVDMPISQAVYRVLYENLPPAEALQQMMAREHDDEWRL